MRDLEFVETNDEQVKIKVKDTATPLILKSLTLSSQTTGQIDPTLLFELGFDKTHQTLDPNSTTITWRVTSTASHYGQLILPSQNFSGRLFYQPNTGDSRPTSLTAFHRYTTENAKASTSALRVLRLVVMFLRPKSSATDVPLWRMTTTLCSFPTKLLGSVQLLRDQRHRVGGRLG